LSVYNAPAYSPTGKVIELPIKREEAMRGRLRATSPDGSDVIIDLQRGSSIRNGDFFGPSEEGVYYQVTYEPEKVLKISLRSDAANIENALRLGYSLGNYHLEILFEGESVYLPLTIGLEKVQNIVRRTGLPVHEEILEKVISTDVSGYFEGEGDEHR